MVHGWFMRWPAKLGEGERGTKYRAHMHTCMAWSGLPLSKQEWIKEHGQMAMHVDQDLVPVMECNIGGLMTLRLVIEIEMEMGRLIK